MQREIGSTFTYDGKEYKVCNSIDWCEGCDFYNKGCSKIKLLGDCANRIFKEMKTFTKSDLKSGMVIRTKHNRMYLVVDNLLISNTGYMNLNSYSENLRHEDSNYDIIQIYDKATCWGYGFSKGLEYISSKEPLWERKEPKEYTMQEIADKLGIPIEKLRIKK